MTAVTQEKAETKNITTILMKSRRRGTNYSSEKLAHPLLNLANHKREIVGRGGRGVGVGVGL